MSKLVTISLSCLTTLVIISVAKQRKQSSLQIYDKSALKILLDAYKTDGVRGVYRGFGSTIFREIPFSLIQFPLWEYFKECWTPTTGLELTPYYVALCGAFSGGIAAGVTTPLDVIKTRIMLAEQKHSKNITISSVLKSVYRDQGFRGLFAGVVPRVTWITLGGAVFFGFYDFATRLALKDKNT